MEGVRQRRQTPQTPFPMEPSLVSTDSASVDGVRLADLAEELPLGRSSVFELLKGLAIKSIKGPNCNGRGRVAWVSSADAERLREAARAVHEGKLRIADVGALAPRTPQTLTKRPPTPSADSTDATAFLQRLEAAERAVSSGLGLTTAETAWILGKEPRGSSCRKGAIVAIHEGVNVWRLTKTPQ